MSCVFISLLLTFWNPPIDLVDHHKSFSQLPIVLPNFDKAGAQKEHDKTTAEILERIKMNNEWFQRKFALVGGLLAYLVGLTGVAAYRRTRDENPDPSRVSAEASTVLRELFFSDGFVIVLGIATALCLVVDIHIRENTLITDQLGMWIAYFYEPMIIRTSFDPGISKGYLGWEQLLRVNGGLHKDQFHAIFFWSSLHSLTMILFFFYMLIPACRQLPACKTEPAPNPVVQPETAKKESENPLIVVTFWTVAALYWMFAIPADLCLAQW